MDQSPFDDSAYRPTVVAKEYRLRHGSLLLCSIPIPNKKIVVTPTEILASMNNCLTGSETGIVGLFTCNNGTGTALTDYSPSMIDGVLSEDTPS